MTAPVITPVAIKIGQDIKDRVQRLAKARNRSAHWVMREAIAQYVEREEKREAFRQEAVDAWEEYRLTGEYVPGEDVAAWLESWGTDNELQTPPCHK